MKIHAFEIDLYIQHFPGYGSPECWELSAICENKKLEVIVDIRSEYELGKQEVRLQEKLWKLSNDQLSALIFHSPRASTPCFICHSPTYRWGCLLGDRTFCKKCSEAGEPEKYKEEMQRDSRLRALKEIERQREELLEEDVQAKEAMHGAFHWRDGIFYKRLANGDVAVRTIRSNPYQMDRDRFPDLDVKRIIDERIIPSSEWASIISSVRIGGESSESYQQALKFHTPE